MISVQNIGLQQICDDDPAQVVLCSVFTITLYVMWNLQYPSPRPFRKHALLIFAFELWNLGDVI